MYERPLRAALLLTGTSTLLVAALWALSTRPSASPLHVAIFVVAALAIGAGALPRLPGRALIAVVLAVAGYLLVTWKWSAVTFPNVDLVRPWGLEKGAYPVFRPMLGLFLLAAGLPAALAGRRLSRALGLAGCAVLLAYLLVPRWYEMDVVEEAGVLPDHVVDTRGPGAIGPGDTPWIHDGQLEHVNWTRYLYGGPPVRLIGAIAYRERIVADLAHGMNAERALAQGAPAFETRTRAVLWSLTKGVSSARLTLEVASLPAWVWTTVRLLWGRRPGRIEARVLVALVIGQLLLVPLVNLTLTFTSMATLPEAATRGFGMVGLTAALLGAVTVVTLAGRSLARHPA